MVTTPRLSVQRATVRFGLRTALDGVDLGVDRAEVVAVLGPSGCGKSTLLRSIAGLQPLDDGSVSVDGRDLAGVPVHRREVGLMFQDQALFPHRDVGGNVAFGLRMQGLASGRIRERIADLLTLVGLPGAQGRPVAELSGGEQQRVALARALAPAPSVLLLDEPLGALDRTLRDRLVGELRRLFTEQGLTVVAVTHDQAEAFALADRIVVMDEGRILQVGRPGEVWGRPASVRAAELLGLSNVVRGVALGGSMDGPLGRLPLPGVADGPTAVVIRPDGIHLVADGPVDAVVQEATFRGPTTELTVEVAEGGSLVASVPSSTAPRRGERVRLAIEAAAVIPVDG